MNKVRFSVTIASMLAIGLVWPVYHANAQCWHCDFGGGGFNYCWAGTAGYSRCTSTSTDCIIGGFQCAVARSTDAASSSALTLSRISSSERSDGRMTLIPTPHSSGIDDIRTAVLTDASEGKLPDDAVRDAILLLDVEPRDDPWAEQMEVYIARLFNAVDLRKSGLSAPAVRCASTICEIAVVQSTQGAARKPDNWQTHFFEVSRNNGFGTSFVESSMLMRVVGNAGDERLAFFTFLHFSR